MTIMMVMTMIDGDDDNDDSDDNNGEDEEGEQFLLIDNLDLISTCIYKYLWWVYDMSKIVHNVQN